MTNRTRGWRNPGPMPLFIIAVILLGVSLTAFASFPSPAPPPFIVQPEQTSSRITIYAEYLADDPGTLSLSDLLSGSHDQLFVPARRSVERLGYRSRVWWIRFSLFNDGNRPLERFMEITPGSFNRLTLFRPDGNGYRVQHAGAAHSPPWGDIRDRCPVFRLELPPQQIQTYYLRIEPALNMNFAIWLNDAPAQLERSFTRDAPYLLLIGLTFGLMVFNAVRYAQARHRAKLVYASFLAAMLLSVLASAGFIGMYHLPWSGLQPRLEMIGLLLALGFGTAFTRHFLQCRDHLPGLDLVLRAAATGVFVFTPVSLSFSPEHAARITYTLALGYGGLFLAAAALATWHNLANARLYLVGRGLLCVALLLVFLGNFGFVTATLPLTRILLLALAAEALMFTIGLTWQRERIVQREQQHMHRQMIEEVTWQTRNETLSRVSHEVRTPMSGILGMAELLADTPLTPNQKECVRVIRASGENLLRIINDVLEHSRLEQGDTRLSRERFDLGDLVMDALELFRERAEEKRIELIAHIHSNVPGKVEGDHGKLRQVLTNILGACVRHTSRGELVLDVSRDPSGLSDHLRFEFIGSALTQAQPVLRSFLEESQEPDADGTALGLSIARQLVETMGGRWGMRENRNQDQVCWISLPLPASPGDDDEVEVDASLLTGRMMLVVDDSNTVTRVIRQQALSWGMRVTVCHAPKEALAAIRTQANLNEPFDVVLLDHQMPGMSGMQLAARIREDSLITHPLALVMLTGVNDAPTAATARNAGIHQVLSKPVSGQRLKAALAAALSSLTDQRRVPDDVEQPRAGLRILVAEDHVLSQKVIRGMIHKLGLEADIVANGAEAVRAVQENEYDIVLMDCEMPEMDGFEATRRIREWEKHHHRPPIPIVALTAHILREHQDRSIAAGMNAYVSKPVEMGSLREVLVRFTAASGGTARGSPPASDETLA